MMKRFPDCYAYILFAAIFFCEIILIHPFGNFPLQDDWTSSLSIYEFIRTGKLFYPAILAAFSIVPIFYGIAVSALFGFSFVLLRMTTVIFAWGCACLFFMFLRRNSFSLKVSFFSTCLLLFSPIFVDLSYTFMSDIPALFFLIASLFFFSKGFQSKNYFDILIGSLFSGIGFFVRQTDIGVALAASLFFMFQSRMDKKKGLYIFGTLAMVIVGASVYFSVFGIRPSMLSMFYLPSSAMWRILRSALFLLFMVTLTSLTLLPVVVSNFFLKKNIYNKEPKEQLLLVLGMLFGGSASYLLFIPFENIITYYGLGPAPFTMQGVPDMWGATFVYIIVFSVLVGVAITALRISKCAWFHIWHDRQWNHFMWYYGIFYLVFMDVAFPWFDRYYLLLIPVTCYAAAYVLENFTWSAKIFCATLFLIAIYSVIGTYNYLAWNNARWALGEQLVKSGIPREQINGGVEWNGWYFYKNRLDPIVRVANQRENISGLVNTFLSIRPEARYVISFASLDNTHIIMTHEVSGLFSNVKKVYALERIKE